MMDHLRSERSPELLPTTSCATITRKQPKFLIIHSGTNNVVKFTSRDILNKLL